MSVVEPFTDTTDQGSKMVVAPGVRTKATAKPESDISKEQWVAVAKDFTQLLYARGTIRYRDVFGNERQSTFCARLTGNNVAFEENVRFEACPVGNTAT